MTSLLRTLALACLLTVAGGLPAAAETSRALFVLDGSGSMWGQVDGRAKIEIAREVMADLVRSLPAGVEVGLAAYGHNRKGDCEDIEILVPVGSDREAVIGAVQALNPKGKTPLTRSIQVASAELRSFEGPASVVVVSDGKETCDGDPCAGARAARESGVDLRVHAVGFDVTPEEAAQLGCIADEGGGRYFGAADAEGLVTAFEGVKEVVVARAPEPAPAPMAAGVLFEDHFERDDLGAGYQVLKPDPNRLALVDGEVLIITTMRPGGLAGTNTVLLDRTFPGDWVATIKMDNKMVRDHEAGLYYFVDEDNYLFLAAWGRCCTSRKPYFGKMLGGAWSRTDAPFDELGGRNLSGYPSESETWHLKIQRDGVKYSAYASVDGKSWELVGETAFLNKNGRIGFGSFLTRDHAMGESPAEFDDLVIRSGP